MLFDGFICKGIIRKRGMIMSSNNNNTTSGGIGFTGLLTVAFIVLKLTGVIDWSWLWVLSPIWITALIAIAILLIVVLVAIIRR